MYIEPGTFNLNNEEDIKLEGHYEIKTVDHTVEDDSYYEKENMSNQAVYITGNVLFRKDTETIDELIKVFIRYTTDPCSDLDLDFSVKSEKQMRWGTICPTQKVLFVYKSKVFIAYGRYIFGYDAKYVVIKRGSKTGLGKIEFNLNYEESEDEEDDVYDDEEDDEYEKEEIYKDTVKNHDIEKDKIILAVPEKKRNCSDYVYSFMIYDQETKVVDAFGMYS